MQRIDSLLKTIEDTVPHGYGYASNHQQLFFHFTTAGLISVPSAGLVSTSVNMIKCLLTSKMAESLFIRPEGLVLSAISVIGICELARQNFGALPVRSVVKQVKDEMQKSGSVMHEFCLYGNVSELKQSYRATMWNAGFFFGALTFCAMVEPDILPAAFWTALVMSLITLKDFAVAANNGFGAERRVVR